MASNLKNFLFTETNWLLEVPAEEPEIIEHYLHDETGQNAEHNHIFKLPGVIGILPVRNTVIYPGTVTPLAVGRTKSKALLKDIAPDESVIGLVTQRNPQTDRPDFSHLYSVGTAAAVLKTIKMPQGSVHIVVHGIARFKITRPIANKPYLKARVRLLSPGTKMTRKLQALIVSVRHTANQVIARFEAERQALRRRRIR